MKKAVQLPRKCCAIHAVSGWMHRSRKGPKTHAGDNNSRPRCLSASAVGAHDGVQTVDRVKEEGSEKTRCDLHDSVSLHGCGSSPPGDGTHRHDCPNKYTSSFLSARDTDGTLIRAAVNAG